ncbi:MAG: phospholipid carrier-dependent glycosyltransferase, partial [Cyanobacteria bacterium P01_H01_bin.58]
LLPGRQSRLAADGTLAHRGWLLLYFLGSYGLWSAIANKDPRYIAPYLPAVAIFLAWGLACWWRRWPWVSLATLGFSILVTLLNLFPIGLASGTWLASTLAPRAQWHPYQGTPYPHVDIIDYVAQARPYQLSTLGGIKSTAAVNQHNISYYGKLQNYQVYGRQVGNRSSMVDTDLRSLSWFYAQRAAGTPWPPTEAEDTGAELVRQLEQSPEFTRDRTWELPNQAELYLYRREQFPTTVTALPDTACTADTALPRLSRVEIPPSIVPGQATPITYEWVGRWQALQSGIPLLTWEPDGTPETIVADTPPWIHDHGIGLGTLRPHPFQANQTILSSAQDINPEGCFQVTERTATLPPSALTTGQYRLVGSYLNVSQETLTPMSVPATVVSLVPANENPPPAAGSMIELDWVTQLREAGQLLSQGPDFLDEIFDPIGRINMYDPIQNYTVQAETSLQQRWQANPDYLNYGYSLVLSQILQLKVDAAIASLEQLVEQDADNPYARAYLGFVNLYALRPRAAQTALRPAIAMAPDSPEIRGLSAIAALFQGNLWDAWQQGRAAIALANTGD